MTHLYSKLMSVGLLACLFSVACTESGSSDTARCVAGESAPCGCTNGDRGAQVCTAEGVFDSCICMSDTADSAVDGADRLDSGGDAVPAPDSMAAVPDSAVAPADATNAGDMGPSAPDGQMPPPDFSSCKRGLGSIPDLETDLSVLSKGTRWWYNWGLVPQETHQNYRALDIEYVPMIWGRWVDVEEAVAAIPEGARFLLGFNEPNFGTQANMSPQEAADLWPQLEEIADRRNLELVSPAVNYCGNDCVIRDPFEWLDQFFAACEGCRVDYVAFHQYNCQVANLSHLLNLYTARYNRPLWVTELACGWPGAENLQHQRDYMREVLAILEADPRVVRYAWFTDRWNPESFMSLLGEGPGVRLPLGDDYMIHPAEPPHCLVERPE